MPQSENKESFFGATRELCANPNFIVLVSTAIVQMAIYQAIEPFTTLYLRDIGISYFQIGLLDLVYSTVIFLIIAGSYLSDLLPHRRSKFAAANSISWGVMCLLYSRITGFWSTVVVFIIAGLSFSMFSTASRAYMLDHTPADKHHFAMGFFALHQVPLLFVFFLLLRSFQVYGFVPGMRTALFLGGGIIVFVGLLRWFFLTDTGSKTREKSNLTLKGLAKENLQTLSWLWKIAPMFLVITVIDAVSDALYSFLIYFFLNEVAAIPAAEILKGRLILDFVSTPIILYLAFRITRKYEKKAVFFLLYLVVPVVILLLLLSTVHPNIPFPDFVPTVFKKLAFFAYSLKTIQDFLWLHILLTPFAARLVPTEHATKALGISWLLIFTSRLFASPLAGWIYQNYTNGATILLYSILTLNFLILVAILTLSSDFEHKSPHNG